MKKKSSIILMVLMIVMFISMTAFASDDATMLAYAETYGALTLLPPVVAIVLALITKNVILSLSVGAFTGAFMLNIGNGNIFASIYNSFFYFTNSIIANATDPWNAGIILQCLTIMALVAVVSKMGGIRAIATWLAKFAKGRRSTQIVTWIMGILIFFDDYANAMIVGPIMRPISDHQKISRERLAFIVDATAAPIAGIAFISTWIATELGTIKDGFDIAGISDIAGEPYGFFLDTIPYRFYNILMLAFVFLSSYMLRDFGLMYKAEYRARKFGKVLSDDAKPMVSTENSNFDMKEGITPSIWDAIIPIGTLIVGAVIGFYSNGYSAIMSGDDETAKALISKFSFSGVQECISSADASVVLFEVSIFAALVALVLAVSKKKLTLTEFFDTWVEGLKSVLLACSILLLAWTLSGFVKELGTRFFLSDFVGSWMPAFLLPAVIFILGSVISFATGTSYGTMGILMPLAIPLAWDISPDLAFVTVAAGAVLTGAIFGDHCSPISDTTILSSTGAAADHIQHFKTQMQYAVVVGAISIVCGFIPAGLGVNPWILNIVGVVAIVLVLKIFGKNVDEEIAKEEAEALK